MAKKTCGHLHIQHKWLTRDIAEWSKFKSCGTRCRAGLNAARNSLADFEGSVKDGQCSSAAGALLNAAVAYGRATAYSDGGLSGYGKRKR